MRFLVLLSTYKYFRFWNLTRNIDLSLWKMKTIVTKSGGNKPIFQKWNTKNEWSSNKILFFHFYTIERPTGTVNHHGDYLNGLTD